jgi:ferredoxin
VPIVLFEYRSSGGAAGPAGPVRRAALEVSAPEGGALIDLCDERSAPVPFSCRSASCGTCRIEVLEGAELLEPPADEELDVLDIFGDDPQKTRLACQAKMKTGPGRLVIRPAED